MKTAFALLVVLLASPLAHAMDLTGIEIREIQIPVDKVEAAKRAEILATPSIPIDDWIAMSEAQRQVIRAKMQELEQAQQDYVERQAKIERAEEIRINPSALCKRRFGAKFDYSGGVSRLTEDGFEHRAYLCTYFGPSKRTLYEKRMIQINGYLSMIRFKIRYPLTAYPG